MNKEMEFLGKIEVYYAEENSIWVYDGLTLGLYRIDIITKKIEVHLTPMQIHKNRVIPIRGIIRKGKNIVLVPQYINDEWILYEIENKQITYMHVFDSPHQIAYVGQDNKIACLVPLNTNEPLFLISLGELKCIKEIKDWYGSDAKKHDVCACFPTDFEKGYMFIPIIHTNSVCRVNTEEYKLITADIPAFIFSASIDRESIWILPDKGRFIYLIDQNGNMILEVNLARESGLESENFVQIIATEKYVFLFPYEGCCLYAYKKDEKRIVKIDAKAVSYWEKNLVQAPCSYWGGYSKNNILHLIPMRYGYAMVDMIALEIANEKLICNESFSEEDYWRWHLWAKRNCDKLLYSEQADGALEKLICFTKSGFMDMNNAIKRKIGDAIWDFCK